MAGIGADPTRESDRAPELGEDRLRRLLDVGRSLVSELDLEAVLQQVLQTAKELTEARYAALGILHREKRELERFLYLGIDEETRRRIGPLPRGKGVLGELIDHPATLRLADVSGHPRSYGFPAKHPPMTTFLGTPVMIRGTAYGNIYLTEKEGGREFDVADEELIVVLAEWASIAIDNARLYESTERQRSELERAVQGLEANVSLARETSGETGLAWLLELIAKRGRGLVAARDLLVLMPQAGDLAVAEAAGELPDGVRAARVPSGEGAIGAAMRSGHAAAVAADGGTAADLGLDPTAGLLAPLRFRGRPIGMLAAFDPIQRGEFSPEDALLLDSFAASAASAIGTAQAVEEEKLRLSIESSEAERRRWAMELHDETLQQLGAMKLMNESALQTADPDAMRKTLERSVSQIEQSIASLEGLITELRPAALDELGAAPALESLIERLRRADTGISYTLELDLAFDAGRESTRLAPDLEATIYRLVQEALNNVHKHADAAEARVAVLEDEEHVLVTVTDDGRGFDAGAAAGRERFGLVGMRERVQLVRGELTIESEPGEGSRVSARLPVKRAEPGQA